jgi:hypothetical protein
MVLCFLGDSNRQTLSTCICYAGSRKDKTFRSHDLSPRQTLMGFTRTGVLNIWSCKFLISVGNAFSTEFWEEDNDGRKRTSVDEKLARKNI